MPKIYNMKEGYKTFRDRIYSYLITYKKRRITGNCGKHKGVANPAFLPEKYWNELVPVMLYHCIRGKVAEILKSEFKYKLHIPTIKTRKLYFSYE